MPNTIVRPHPSSHGQVTRANRSIPVSWTPATHTIGMLARAVRVPDYVHAYFHDTDLLHRGKRLALAFGLRQLALRRPVSDLDELSRALAR